MWQFATVLRPRGNGAGMMDEGVKQNCHSTAEALINCQDGWRVWQGSLENGAPRRKRGPHFWHLLQKENTLGLTSDMHKKQQMVQANPWELIPRKGAHSCILEKFVHKPCWASQSPLAAVASDSISISGRAHKQAQHSTPFFLLNSFISTLCFKFHFEVIKFLLQIFFLIFLNRQFLKIKKNVPS